MEDMIAYLLQMDGVLLILGIVGIVFAAVRRDKFIVLWSIPFLVFLTAINYVGLFQFVPLIPVFCIAAATIPAEIYKRIASGKKKDKKREEVQPTITTFIAEDNSGNNIKGNGSRARDENESAKYSFD
jgi:hypothetical protein